MDTTRRQSNSLGSIPETQFILQRFAEAEISLRELWHRFTVPQENQDPLNSSAALDGLAPFCALRRSALSAS